MKRIATRFFCFFLLTLSLSATAFGFENTLSPTRAYLGVHLEEISKQKAALLGADNAYGSYITRVIPGSAAEKAGLKPLDYVVGIDQHKTDDDTDLEEILEIYEAGSEATLHLFRQGKPMDIKVTFGPKSNESESNKTRSFLGISPADEDDDDDDATVGVAVDVTKESAAAAMGLQDGDVITAINGYTMIDWTDISAIIRSLEPESDVTLSIRRNDETLTKTGKMGKKDSEEYAISSGRLGTGFSWSGSGNWKQAEDQSGDAFLGVNLGTMSKEKAKKLGFSNAYGTYVSSVIPGTGAAKAGLQAFDYIYGVDEYRVGEGQSLSFILRKFSAGQKANIYFIRKGQERNVSVTLSSKNEDYDEDNDWEDDCDRPFLGVSQSHETYADKGVQVNIVEGSTAKEMGMKAGDLLTSINGYPIIDWGDISMALGTIKAGSTVSVDYLREGKKVSASKVIKSVCDARKSTSYNFNFNRSDDKSKEEGWAFKSAPQIVRVNPANVKAKMEDMGKEDVDKLKAQGVTMSGINNLRLEKINLFPNPTKGLFRLQFDLPEKGQTEVKVLNAAGRTIYEYELGNFSGEFSDEVDISQNGVGTYFLQIRQGDKYASKKIVLQ
ncbi:PDZ domain-containing protein [Haliscomenobacter hydrossis]|uniref:PDZ/DHR/GLGF domain protein n=1 Tax=Haliscomenobacter hydrossis (strain ATCC 27775 / DSM 1100 / LMG 10767 / O) TaxID=760192 RepID=F4KSK4_HALH1|nr:PDZ domain-containing protein [Haliscomenobacter hydrossis]AEE54355.1 PDZ/DHR/GLGF domain protein [Haliscomenobacter hydrossis DSM 1100]